MFHVKTAILSYNDIYKLWEFIIVKAILLDTSSIYNVGDYRLQNINCLIWESE